MSLTGGVGALLSTEVEYAELGTHRGRRLRGRVERWLAAFLTRPVRRYERHGWNDLDAALVRAADQLHETAFIDDETWATLAKEFNTHQMMELVMTVGGYHMLAMALNSFGVQLDEGREGFPK